MSYSKFKKLEQLRNDFSLTDIQANWLPTHLPSFEASTSFLEFLQEAGQKQFMVVLPMLFLGAL